MKLPLALLSLALPVTAAAAEGPDEHARFAALVQELRPLCAAAASTVCATRVFQFADRDRSGDLNRAELERMSTLLRQWSLAHRGELPASAVATLATSVLVIETVGVAPILASYDADRNGRLTFAEATADVQLDERPLPEVVNDPNGVNWPRIKQRVGPYAGFLLDRVIRRVDGMRRK